MIIVVFTAMGVIQRFLLKDIIPISIHFKKMRSEKSVGEKIECV
jgi:hypothetical protein